jgi:hypothetical protein
MQTLRQFLLGLLCVFSLLAPASAADTHTEQAIPIQIFKSTLDISKGATRDELKAKLSAITKESPSVDTAERLQYDLQLIVDSGPVSFAFDFDRKGVLTHVSIDSYMKEHNPTVTTLLAWLDQNAGKPNVQRKGKRVWNQFRSWKIEHKAGGSGDNSTYRIELSALR